MTHGVAPRQTLGAFPQTVHLISLLLVPTGRNIWLRIWWELRGVNVLVCAEGSLMNICSFDFKRHMSGYQGGTHTNNSHLVFLHGTQHLLQLLLRSHILHLTQVMLLELHWDTGSLRGQVPKIIGSGSSKAFPTHPIVPAGWFPQATDLEHLLDSVHQLRSHAISWQHGYGKGALHPQVLGLWSGPSELALEWEQGSWGWGGRERGGGRDSSGPSACLPGFARWRAPQARYTGSAMRRGWWRPEPATETHEPMRSGLEPPDPEYCSEPGRKPPLPCPPPARPGLPSGLTRVSQRAPLRAAMFSTGSRDGSDATNLRDLAPWLPVRPATLDTFPSSPN